MLWSCAYNHSLNFSRLATSNCCPISQPHPSSPLPLLTEPVCGIQKAPEHGSQVLRSSRSLHAAQQDVGSSSHPPPSWSPPVSWRPFSEVQQFIYLTPTPPRALADTYSTKKSSLRSLVECFPPEPPETTPGPPLGVQIMMTPQSVLGHSLTHEQVMPFLKKLEQGQLREGEKVFKIQRLHWYIFGVCW